MPIFRFYTNAATSLGLKMSYLAPKYIRVQTWLSMHQYFVVELQVYPVFVKIGKLLIEMLALIFE